MALTKTPIELSSTPSIVDGGNATAITIDSSENVGIGGNVLVGVGNGHEPVIQSTNSGRLPGSPGFTFRDDFDTGMYQPISTPNTVAFSTGGTERMRLDASGNLLVGTTTHRGFSGSTTEITIGTASTGATAGGAVTFDSGSGFLGYLAFQESEGTLGTLTSVPLVFKTGNTERMRIDSSGNVGVGVTPSAWGASYDVIDLNTGAAIYGTNSGASVAGNLYYTGASWIAKNTGGGALYATGSGGEHYWYSSASVTGGTTAPLALKASISSAGSLSCPAWYTNTTALAATAYIATGPQGELYRSTSSIKYKRDVETIEDIYADALLDVRPVFYRSKSDNDNSAHGFWGIIAEELAEIDPRLVHWQTHVPVEVTDDDGVVTTEMVELDTPEAEGVQYERFVPLLINLAKRQRDQITAQAAAIADLTTRLTALENN